MSGQKTIKSTSKRGRFVTPHNAPKPELQLAPAPKGETFLVVHGKLHIAKRQGVYRRIELADYGLWEGAKATFFALM